MLWKIQILLRDFAAELTAFKESVADLKNDIRYTKYPDFQQFLTSAVHSLMKYNDFTSIQSEGFQRCGRRPRKRSPKTWKENFGILDNESAMQSIGTAEPPRNSLGARAQFDMYDDEEFRKEMEKLSPAGRDSFLEKCKEFADLFKPGGGKSGFFAWDIALGVDIIFRESVFRDYFDEPTARKMMDDLMKPLLKMFDNWGDFAVSFIAGGTVLRTY